MRVLLVPCLATVLIACSSGSPESCRASMSCANGTITFCTSTPGCRYRTSSGTSFACDDCARCQDAANAAAAWCASGSGVGGTSGGADGGSGGGSGGTPYDLGPNVTLNHLLMSAPISVQPGQAGVYQVTMAGRYGITFLLAQDPFNPPAAMVFTVDSPADITEYSQGGVIKGTHEVTFTTPTDLSSEASVFFTLVPADAPFELAAQSPDRTIHYVTASGLATAASPAWFVSP